MESFGTQKWTYSRRWIKVSRKACSYCKNKPPPHPPQKKKKFRNWAQPSGGPKLHSSQWKPSSLPPKHSGTGCGCSICLYFPLIFCVGVCSPQLLHMKKHFQVSAICQWFLHVFQEITSDLCFCLSLEWLVFTSEYILFSLMSMVFLSIWWCMCAVEG